MMHGNDKVPLLCNYGGDFVFKSGKYLYEGGIRRLIFVCRSIKQHELLLKVNEICKPTVISTIKYRYPGLKLDSSLVYLVNDEDVSNMMQLFIQSSAPKPIQLYAISSQSPSISTPIADVCHIQGLENVAIQGRQRVIHDDRETVASSPHMVNASTRDRNQIMMSHPHEEACTITDKPNHDNGSIQTLLTVDTYNDDDVPSMSSLVELHEEDHPRGANESSNVQIQSQMVDDKEAPKVYYTLHQGQEFRDLSAVDMALREHAIHMHFQYKPIRTDHSHIAAKCIRDGCPWRISASKVPDRDTFKIELLDKEHTCESTILDCKNHRQASMNWIANFIIRNRKHLHSTPKDIMNDIALQYGIEVDYHKARRGRELALKEKHLGDYISDISAYCDKIETTNPGSFVALGFSLDGSFGVFIAYHAAICGFQWACRPIIILYGRSIEGKYPHIWLFASGLDANNEEFLLAYAIVESSNKETWTWFCVQLACILKDTSEITIVTGRHEKSSEAVGVIFPKARHRYCRKSLYNDFCRSFECRNLRELFSDAIFADTIQELDSHLSNISSASSEACQWINEISPSRKDWAVSHFDVKGQDFKHPPCEKVFDIWTDDENEMAISSVISSLEQFHAKIIEIFQRRIKEGSLMKELVTPYASDRLCSENLLWELADVLHIPGIQTQFYVVPIMGSTTHLVDIKEQNCTCHIWMLHKFPCSHALAVLHRNKSNLFDYCDWYTVTRYQEAYSKIIYPIEHTQRMEDEMNEMPKIDRKRKKRAHTLQKLKG